VCLALKGARISAHHNLAGMVFSAIAAGGQTGLGTAGGSHPVRPTARVRRKIQDAMRLGRDNARQLLAAVNSTWRWMWWLDTIQSRALLHTN
jgi:hypothetical protein